MKTSDHPILQTWKITDLHPMQLTVGLREVARKRKAWEARRDKDGGTYLGQHMVPVVIGPGDQAYIQDNHHMTRALYEAGVEEVLVQPLAKLGWLAQDEFWTYAAKRNWLHLYDASGRLCTVKDLPKTVAGLQDDPYRSLAGELRRAGGYAKQGVPFSEFLWADFLRLRLKAKLVETDFAKALAAAMTLARGEDARHLPGWSGIEED